jgi:heavy metal sensor kinase
VIVPRPRTVRMRLTLWYTALLSGMLALLGAAALTLLDRGLRANLDDSLLSVARVVATSSRAPAAPPVDLEDLVESMLGPGFTERFFRLLDPRGRPDARVASRPWQHFGLSAEALRNAERGRETYETLAPPAAAAGIRLLTLPVIESGRLVNLVQVAMSLRNVDAARTRFLAILLGLAPLALGGAAAGGWFLARRALAPVDAMVEAARAIEAEDLSRRLEGAAGGDELGRLATVLNDMLGRLERAFAAARNLSADVAHELRTPLTIIKGEIEVALRAAPSEDEYRRVLQSCLEEVDRLGGLVEDLLFLARAESGTVGLPAAPVDLAEVLADVAPALHALAQRAGVRCSVGASPPLRVRGHASLLFRLLFNLGENAVKYTPAGGHVDVALRSDAAAAIIEVRDTGPGIPSEDRSRIFDRFYRRDPARTRGGTGLGLALARSIVLLHGGVIDVASTPGRGSCFRVVLPRAEDAAAPRA